MNLAIVYGTRPEAVKLSKVVEALRGAGTTPTILCTNQHTDLLRGTPAEDVMRPDVQLGVPGLADPLAYVRLCEGALRAKLATLKPDVVVVQGDTASAYAGALAAAALDIPVAHVEAGIRSGDTNDPWPEDLFRVGIDQIAGRRFGATQHAMENLEREVWLPKAKVGPWVDVLSGNPGIDALYAHTQPLTHPGKMQDRVLVTLHRRESFGTPLCQIVTGLAQAAQDYPSLEFLWPTHPNPKVHEALGSFPHLPQNVHILPPLPTIPFARLLARSRLVLTDSGGVQEEAAALGVPCLVARERTDRPESVELGLAKVVGRTSEGLKTGFQWALGFQARCTPSDCFGDGHAAERIVSHLLSTP